MQEVKLWIFCSVSCNAFQVILDKKNNYFPPLASKHILDTRLSKILVLSFGSLIKNPSI